MVTAAITTPRTHLRSHVVVDVCVTRTATSRVIERPRAFRAIPKYREDYLGKRKRVTNVQFKVSESGIPHEKEADADQLAGPEYIDVSLQLAEQIYQVKRSTVNHEGSMY